jgi:two-component system sensor histidine kinase BaeS
VTASGRTDGAVWAATPVPAEIRVDQRPRRGGSPPTSPDPGTAVVVASAPDAPQPAPVLGVFAWVALGTVVVGGLVALVLARGLTVPLRRAEEATARIAAGDLSARVEPPGPRTPTEVADLSSAINTMASELERSQGLDRQFLMSVSHDLRTPLTSIRGWSEAIADGTARDPAAAARVIEGEAKRLDRLVGDLLDLGRIDSRQFSLVPDDVEMGPLVAGIAAGARPDADAAGLIIDVIDRGAGAHAHVDPDRLGQVVANLVENALKFASSRVVVVIDADPSWVSVTVGDDGPGIAPEDLPHVFDRLYVSRQVPPRRESGSGLGLAIVRELTTAMGGTVDVRSPNDSGTGTDLRVAFPRASSSIRAAEPVKPVTT